MQVVKTVQVSVSPTGLCNLYIWWVFYRLFLTQYILIYITAKITKYANKKGTNKGLSMENALKQHLDPY